MLRTLELRDFAIVDELTVEFGPGLNVVTGETGAGKSIVVDALGLLAGARPDAAMIREGAEDALIQGLFDGAALASAARRLSASGRHSARIDGELVTVAELSERGSALVAVFGQHAASELPTAAFQRAQLDRLLSDDATAALARHRRAYERLSEVLRSLSELRSAERERARRVDVLSHQIAEIARVNAAPGEDDDLRSELDALQHAERIVSAAARAFTVLSDADENAVSLAAEAQRELDAAGQHAQALADLARDLREAVTALGAVATEVETFLSDFEADPARLDAVQSRLAALDDLKRKYGEDLAAVHAYRLEAEAELARLGSADVDVDRLEHERASLEAELDEAGAVLGAARRGSATELERAVEPLLHLLGMPKARFEVDVTPLAQRGPHGAEGVRFLFSANAGEALQPLANVASGGELSRAMLALHLVTGSDVPTVVFDEVDAGIGGATARHVGALLRQLARTHQVLVVTHLAQVGAYADTHFVVRKVEVDGRTVARAERLATGERPAELARMLSGTVTDASLRHARELFEEAQAALR
ncbi:MAG: DNA repair protein RecN [Trueperaceae bacterium]